MFLQLLLGLSAVSGLQLRQTTRKFTSLGVSVADAPPITGASGKEWRPDSWRNFDVEQLPIYNDQQKLKSCEEYLRRSSPLVFAGEVRTLQEKLAKACNGESFVVFGGDCAESFDEFKVDHVRDTFRVILQMALVMTFGGAMPVVKIGRMAGQFAKPRSSGTEEKMIDGVEVSLPSYRGDNVNSEEFTAEAREPDPDRMVQAYHQCTQTMNILRAFAVGGYADVSRLHAWNLDFVADTPTGESYRQLAGKVDEALRFVNALGISKDSSTFTQADFFTAHECLLLQYEEALTRQDSISGDWFDTSAHLLWVGERTRQRGKAHLEFVSGISNPLGVKISDKCTPEQLIGTIEDMNPDNIPGKLTLIMRMGAANVREYLPPLISAVEAAGKNVVWVCDPVHANTFKAKSGYKTRDFADICDELRAFFDVHERMGTHAGGVHIEMTGEDVTECVGGMRNLGENDLSSRYHTHCDPRLNGEQALELAFRIAERLRRSSGMAALTDTTCEVN